MCDSVFNFAYKKLETIILICDNKLLLISCIVSMNLADIVLYM